MVTVAEGRLVEIGTAPRGSGFFAVLVHRPKMGEHVPFFLTSHAHIYVDEDFKKRYKKGEVVPRGTVVGHAAYPAVDVSAKLNIQEGFSVDCTYFVDAENYGQGHKQLDYWDGNVDFDKDLINKFVGRFNTQVKCLETMVKMCMEKDMQILTKWKKSEASLYTYPVQPSIIERWRKVETLWQKEPEKFQGNKEEIENLIKEFYANQPVILTLPFRKP